MKLNALLFALLLAGASCTKANAELLNFDFSFSNTIGNTNGTVTGEIIGLPNNAITNTYIESEITSAPVGFGIPPAVDVFYLGYFNVVNGVITQAQYGGQNSATGFVFTLNYDYNALQSDYSYGLTTENNGGFAGATYTEVIPEPNDFALLFFGSFMLVAIRRLKPNHFSTS